MCTAIRFNGQSQNFYFGRNLDWTTSYGQKVIITPKNFYYHSAFLGEITPKAGAIIGMGINIENTPLYFDCANEAGLAIAGLNFPDYAKFEESPIAGKTNIAQYEFPLLVCLNYSTVDEVEAALQNTAIVAKPINKDYPASSLHYLIGDQNRSIVVEYTKNGMEIFHNDYDVLTNAPGFLEQTKNLITGSDALPGNWTPPARFSRVAYLNSHYPIKTTEIDNILRLFHTLSGVSMIDGAILKDGHYEKTIYTSGYSSASKTYYYNTYENPAITCVSMPSYDLESPNLIEI